MTRQSFDNPRYLFLSPKFQCILGVIQVMSMESVGNGLEASGMKGNSHVKKGKGEEGLATL